MPALSYLKLTNRLRCQGSVTTYGVLHAEDLDSASDVQAIEDQESLSFAYSRVDRSGEARAITAQMRAGRVLTVMWDDGAFDEWRVGAVELGRGQGGLVRVECISLVNDLVERADSSAGKGWVSELNNGERVFDYEIAERTASSTFTTYVIPNLPSWITLGTVDPTAVIPALSVNHLTPWALALAVRDSLRAMDVSCELRLRRTTANLVLQTEALDQSPWTDAGATVTPNTTVAPDGTTTADTVVATGGWRGQPVDEDADGDYTASVYLKQGTATRNWVSFGNAAGGGGEHVVQVDWSGAPTITSVSGSSYGAIFPVEGPDAYGFYRIAFTVYNVFLANVNSIVIFPDLITFDKSVIAWGAQVNRGTVLQPYSKNTASVITGYKLDLLTQIGSSAAVPVFHPHVSLKSLKQRTDPTLQATRILVRGGTAPDTFPGVLGRARWRGGAPT